MKKDKIKLPTGKELKEKMFTKEGIPKCVICQKPMVNAYDRKLKAISPYLWKPTCEHNKGLQICMG